MTPFCSLRTKPADLTRQGDDVVNELAEILFGLGQSPKRITSKFFYDKRGSKLFDQICNLPEYYLTRTELAIMQAHTGDIADLIGPQASLIEFGSGSSTKTRLLLRHIPNLAAYVPVDISHDHLVAASDAIAKAFPAIEVLPVAADFTRPFDLPVPGVLPVRNVVYFPGSTIGNFSPAAALDLLKVMHHMAGENGRLLIGIDLQKDVDMLNRAYNDSTGITAAFNLNILRHLNREFGANFDLAAYQHFADYNQEAGRIEMYLVSQSDQEITLGGESFRIKEGERILTEHSHKYTLDGFAEMASKAGFEVNRWWTDDDRLFAVCYLSRQ